MTDFTTESKNTFPASSSVNITPTCYDYETEFQEAENANGKVVIKNIAAPIGVEAEVTFQVNELAEGKFYKKHPFGSEVSNPLAKGKSLFVKLSKTNSQVGADGKDAVSASDIYLCYKSENREWTEEEVLKALKELCGFFYNTDGSSRVKALLKKVLVPKGC